MVKKIMVVLSLIAIIGFCGINITVAQDMATTQQDEEITVKGVVTSISEDGSSLVLNEETLTIDPDLREYINVEAGDSVELIVKMVDGKKVVIDFDYIDLE